ncbi:MAG: PspC domain-containing protein [Pseudobutyrivibrio sp.]|nr:PspC domain-containing protein [Pseudobutyrivibrio sp.]
MKKRLYKSTDKKVCGVCGGIADYLDLDPTVVRLLWVIFTLAGGSGIIAYIVAAIIMEDDPGYIDVD